VKAQLSTPRLSIVVEFVYICVEDSSRVAHLLHCTAQAILVPGLPTIIHQDGIGALLTGPGTKFVEKPIQ
jgi:hypothetical protein